MEGFVGIEDRGFQQGTQDQDQTAIVAALLIRGDNRKRLWILRNRYIDRHSKIRP